MPDTPPAAGTGQQQQQTSQGNADAGSAPGRQSPDPQIAATLDAHRKLQERYDNLQKAYGRQAQELGTLRQQQTVDPYADGYGYGSQETTAPPQEDVMSQRLVANEQRMDLMQYRMEVPDWQGWQTDVDKIISDEVRVHEVAAYKPNPSGGAMVDWYRTYKNAKQLVELERYRTAAQGSANGQSQTQDEQRNQMALAGTLSGDTSSASQQATEFRPEDLKGKSANEIAKIARDMGYFPEQGAVKVNE